MEISKSMHGDYSVFSITEEINMDTSKVLSECLTSEIESGATKVIFDLAQVEHIDSTGLGTLIAIHRRLQKSGSSLILVNIPENVYHLLMLSRLVDIFTIYESLDRIET